MNMDLYPYCCWRCGGSPDYLVEVRHWVTAGWHRQIIRRETMYLCEKCLVKGLMSGEDIVVLKDNTKTRRRWL